MKKLRLDLERLEVDGFATHAPLAERGTVQGQRTIIEGTCDISCVPSGCANVCTPTC